MVRPYIAGDNVPPRTQSGLDTPAEPLGLDQ